MATPGRIRSRPPDKGSFPLDHFHECDKEAKSYTECVTKHELMPKRCRMNAGLMDKEEMAKLGIIEQTSWDTEEQEQKFLFEKIQRIKEKAWDTSLQRSYQDQESKKKETGDIPKQ